MKLFSYLNATETRLVRLGSFRTEINGQGRANYHIFAIKILLEISLSTNVATDLLTLRNELA